jgi:hypothetical protein
MKRIYLDWGVVSNLKKIEFADIKDFLLSKKGELFFVYSPAHFEDAMRSEGDSRLLQDIQMLESLVEGHLIAYNQNTVQPFLATPSQYYRDNKGRNLDVIPDVFELVNSISQDVPLAGGLFEALLGMPFPILSAARSQELVGMMLPNLPAFPSIKDVLHSTVSFVNQMLGSKEFYKSYRSAIRAAGFKVDPNAGNWKSEEVVPNITARLKSLGIDKSFREFVSSGFGDNSIDDFQFFIAAYNLLDLIGYRSDKLPKGSNSMNSVNTDAQHAFYGAFCDYLITQDKHLASKACALYHEFGIPTKILSPSDAVDELKDERKDDLVLFLEEQLIEEHIERQYEDAIVYKFKHRFLGCFTHCVLYYQEDSTLIEFKLAFDNYSRFLFFDEAGMMVDAVCDYLGRPPKKRYENARKRIIDGDLKASIDWTGEDILFSLRVDSERLRPELFVKIPAKSISN